MADRTDLQDSIDMTDARHDNWVRASNDPAIWHEAAIAVFLYLGDRHGSSPGWCANPISIEQPRDGCSSVGEGRITFAACVRGFTQRFTMMRFARC